MMTPDQIAEDGLYQARVVVDIMEALAQGARCDGSINSTTVAWLATKLTPLLDMIEGGLRR